MTEELRQSLGGSPTMKIPTYEIMPMALMAIPLSLAASLQVNTSSGNVQGYSPYPGIQAYLGIPYAEPPIGNLRFAPSQHIATPAKETLDATSFGPTCIQFTYKLIVPDRGFAVTGESENCLSINIWTHDNATNLPILFYVHGGGFTGGASSVPLYNPIEIVKQHQDVMVVSFNYRLNVFGFPNTKALTQLNPGLRDLRTAIEWTSKNIEAFGGDPKRITLFGESAGAMAISLYSYQYIEDPMVVGISMMSGQALSSRADRGEEWPRIANAVGCADQDAQKELDCMRAKSALELKRATSPSLLNYFGDPDGGTPAVDNETFFSVEEYVRRASAGNFTHIPMLIGNTNDEAEGLLPYDPVNGVDAAWSKNLTEINMHCPTAYTADAVFNASVPIWRYRYRGVFPSVTPYSWIKSYHGCELAMLFGSIKSLQFQTPNADELAASKLMMQAWVSFAKDPKEGLTKDLQWPIYNPNNQTLIEFFEGNKPEVTFGNPAEYDAVCNNPGIPTGQYGKYC